MRALKRRLSNVVYTQMVDDQKRREADGPGRAPGTTLQSSAADPTPTSALRTSHFPDPPPPSLEPASPRCLDIKGCHVRTVAPCPDDCAQASRAIELPPCTPIGGEQERRRWLRPQRARHTWVARIQRMVNSRVVCAVCGAPLLERQGPGMPATYCGRRCASAAERSRDARRRLLGQLVEARANRNNEEETG